MRGLLFNGVIVAAAWVGLTPAIATPLAKPGLSGPRINATQVEKVGYWRRQYRRYGYPAPYAYYSPGYGYYQPPVVYAYPPAAYSYQPAPPVYGDEAPPPAASPSVEEDYGDHPPADGDYQATQGEYGE